MFMLKKSFVAHVKTNFGYHEDMKGTLVSVKQLPFCNSPQAGRWETDEPESVSDYVSNLYKEC